MDVFLILCLLLLTPSAVHPYMDDCDCFATKTADPPVSGENGFPFAPFWKVHNLLYWIRQLFLMRTEHMLYQKYQESQGVNMNDVELSGKISYDHRMLTYMLDGNVTELQKLLIREDVDMVQQMSMWIFPDEDWSGVRWPVPSK